MTLASSSDSRGRTTRRHRRTFVVGAVAIVGGALIIASILNSSDSAETPRDGDAVAEAPLDARSRTEVDHARRDDESRPREGGESGGGGGIEDGSAGPRGDAEGNGPDPDRAGRARVFDDVTPSIGPAGLETAVTLERESVEFGDVLAASIELKNEGPSRLEVPSPLALWYPELAVSARFESPPSSEMESGRWYRLGPPMGVEGGHALVPPIKLRPGRSFHVDVRLQHVMALEPGRESENRSVWSGRLTEGTGVVQIKVESLDADGGVVLRLGVATFVVPPGGEQDRAALAWLREKGVLRALGPSAFWGMGVGGPDLAGRMATFLELFPESRFRDEARFSLAVGLHGEGKDVEALALLGELSRSADSADLRAYSVVQTAQVHRDNRDKSAVWETLAVIPDPGENPDLTDRVRSLRAWANR